MIQFPVSLRFKFLALAEQISVRDAQDREVLYVKQKMFKLKEHVMVYRDSSQSELLFEIHADRLFDVSARYAFVHSSTNTELGHVARMGMRSFWRASYDVYSGQNQLIYHISEENPWVKLLDGILEAIPLVGPVLNIFQGMFLNPKYIIRDELTNKHVLTLVKQRSITEGIFTLEPAKDEATGETFDPYTVSDEKLMTLILGVLMMALLEKERG